MLEIKEIQPTKKNLKAFTKFQIDLYDGNPWYVPPLISDDVQTLSPSLNPAHDFCDQVLYMAYRDGKVVGRIAGIINRQVNEKERERAARFGFIDFVDDPEVSAALLGAVEKWSRDKGMNKLIGPLGFTDLDHEGMLVEGFDELSTMATIYNYPYYPQHMERMGFHKDAEWVEYRMTVPDKIPEKMLRVAEIVKKKYGVRTIKYTSAKKIKEEYGMALFELINEAYDQLYGYSPLSQRQIEYYIDIYLPILRLENVCLIVDSNDKLIGVGISIPSMSRALQKGRGRLLPTGWIHLLKAMYMHNDVVDLLLVAIKPEYQSKGVNALLFADLLPVYIKNGYRWAESNPELADNENVQLQWQYFERRQHRRRAAFRKDIPAAK